MKKNISKRAKILVLSIIMTAIGLMCFGLNGDVNNSGDVSINDALMIAQYSAGITVAGFNAGNADTNCDKQVNIADALVIARYTVGLGTICNPTTPTPTRTPTATPTPTNGITKIMPLGDSITDGVGLTDGGSYRIKLWSLIQQLGKTIDFVGSLSNGPSELPDKNHEGHSGWTISQIDTNINSWMDTYKPQIVLLHIGTNDVVWAARDGASSRLNTLIDKICVKLPAGGKLYVAQIVPWSGGDQYIVSYNADIPGIVQSKQNAGKPVYMVDMHSAVSVSDLGDGVHPNRTGYDKMADVWFKAIKNDL